MVFAFLYWVLLFFLTNSFVPPSHRIYALVLSRSQSYVAIDLSAADQHQLLKKGLYLVAHLCIFIIASGLCLINPILQSFYNLGDNSFNLTFPQDIAPTAFVMIPDSAIVSV